MYSYRRPSPDRRNSWVITIDVYMQILTYNFNSRYKDHRQSEKEYNKTTLECHCYPSKGEIGRLPTQVIVRKKLIISSL